MTDGARPKAVSLLELCIKSGSIALALTLFCLSQSRAEDTVLAGTSWFLEEFRSSSDDVGVKRPKDPKTFTMTLNADGTVSMRLDCNRGNGTWQSKQSPGSTSGTFTFGTFAVTRALCPPPNLGDFLISQTPYIRTFLVDGDMLHLSLMADGGVFSWRRTGAAQAPKSPEDGGPRNWQVAAGASGLNLREEPSTDARVLAAYPSGTVLDNLGCRKERGRFWCDVQKLGGGPRGFVVADFIQPAVSPDGSVATGEDTSALRAGQGQFDATGTVPCAENLGQPANACKFGVARSGGGYATVVVTRPSGRQRIIYFRMGRAIGASMSEADRWEGFTSRRDSDLIFVGVGAERYEIPDAVVFGG